ncbi:hypothetical protein [Persephonella sp.]
MGKLRQIKKLLLIFPSPKATINDLLFINKHKNQIKDSQIIISQYFPLAYFQPNPPSTKTIINSYRTLLTKNSYQLQPIQKHILEKYTVLKFNTPLAFLKDDTVFINYKSQKLSRYILNLLKTYKADTDIHHIKKLTKNLISPQTGEIQTDKLHTVINSFKLPQSKQKLIIHKILQKNWLKEHIGFMDYAVFTATTIMFSDVETIYLPQDKTYYHRLAMRIYNHNKGLNLPEPPKCVSLKSYNLPDIKGYGIFANPEQQVFLDLPQNKIEERIFRIRSDQKKTKKTDRGSPYRCVVFEYLKAFLDKNQLTQIKQDCENGSIGCVDCRRIVWENFKKLYLI